MTMDQLKMEVTCASLALEGDRLSRRAPAIARAAKTLVLAGDPAGSRELNIVANQDEAQAAAIRKEVTDNCPPPRAG